MTNTITQNIIWLISVWGCAVIFLGLGIYAAKSKKPMSFWSGTTVPPESITDITAYNREYSLMWKIFSLPFWITGITFFWFPVISAVIMALSSIWGIVWMVWKFEKITKKYKK